MHASSVDEGIDIMRLLLDAGSSVNAKSDTDDTALMLLVRLSSSQDLRQLIAISLLLERGASVEHLNNQGWTALMLASYKGCGDIVRILLKHGASANVRTDTGDTAVALAQKADHTEIVNLLSEYSVSAVNSSASDECGVIGMAGDWVSLLQAATVGDDALVLGLLQAQVPIDRQTLTGETVLVRAVWGLHVQILRQLIKFGANLVLVDDSKWSAVLVAAHMNNVEITRLLVEADVAIDALGQDGESALMRAASKGNGDIIRILLEHGASVELENSNKGYDYERKRWTALTFAASGRFESIVKLLIQAGAAVTHSEDYDCDCPLICAARNGHEDVVRMLIEYGAQVNAIDRTRDFSKTRSSGQQPLVMDKLLRF